MLTGKSRIADVAAELHLKDEMEWLFGRGFWESEDTLLQDIGHLGGQNSVKSVHGGLNALAQMKEKGILPIRPIWDEEAVTQDKSRADTALYCFPAANRGPFALICPGGGYGCVVSVTEGLPIAAALNKLGVTAFVLLYRVGENARYPAPQDDLAQALRLILKNADEYNVTRENYSVWGFSAGGHLAASFGTPNMGYAHYGLPAPAALVLSYPVVTMGQLTHEGSRTNLLGENADEAAQDFASVEKHVDRHYPCTYIWTCRGDGVVPFANSRMLKQSLSDVGVRHRLKVVEGTAHGWSLANGTEAEGWFTEAVAFWRSCMTR